jgi:hypothetical protein
MTLSDFANFKTIEIGILSTSRHQEGTHHVTQLKEKSCILCSVDVRNMMSTCALIRAVAALCEEHRGVRRRNPVQATGLQQSF